MAAPPPPPEPVLRTSEAAPPHARNALAPADQGPGALLTHFSPAPQARPRQPRQILLVHLWTLAPLADEPKPGILRRNRFSLWSVVVLAWLVLIALGSATVATASSDSGLGSSHAAALTSETRKVGALFRGGVAPFNHFCTASVVTSPGRSLIVSAAHCLSGDNSDLLFAPGYHDGLAPYGVWQVVAVQLDADWQADEDPDHDFAFAEVAPLHGRYLQDVVGGNRLGVGADVGGPVHITGYPSVRDEPITCSNGVSWYSPTQLRIYCADYSDGTSGSPWVTKLDKTGTGTVVGVIGGFEQGGYTDDVSYTVYFASTVAALYSQAVALGG